MVAELTRQSFGGIRILHSESVPVSGHFVTPTQVVLGGGPGEPTLGCPHARLLCSVDGQGLPAGQGRAEHGRS